MAGQGDLILREEWEKIHACTQPVREDHFSISKNCLI
jgi:hypothetical protein